MDYKNWNYGTVNASADTDTVETAIMNGVVTPVAPSATDLYGAAEWLALYASDDNLEMAQSFTNVIAFLQLTADAKDKRKAVNNAKREYAKQNGVKFSQVRYNAKKAN
jgi:hypothetical protein